MTDVRRMTPAAACLLAALLLACGRAPTTPTPLPPPGGVPAPPPPAPPSEIAIAGDYDLMVRLSATCVASDVGRLFSGGPHPRSRVYSARIFGRDKAFVELGDADSRVDPAWGYGNGFQISQEEQTVQLHTSGVYAPDVMEVIAEEEWLMLFISRGTGQIRDATIDVRWAGRVSLVRTQVTFAWSPLHECDAEDHEMIFRRREP